MRPRGDIRTALAHAVQHLPRDGFTWRDAAQVAGVGFSAAQLTLRNMASAGELERAGTMAVPWANRPMVRYRPPAVDTRAEGAAALQAAMRVWAEFV